MKLKFLFCCLLMGLFPGLLSQAQEAEPLWNWNASVVTVDVTRKHFDYFQPWSKRTRNVQKSGLVIANKEIITTADELADRTLVRVQKEGRGKWWNGEVTWVDYHANLALITVSEEAFWKDLQPAELANPTLIKGPTQILRWREGRLETRRAEFNQYTVRESHLSFVQHLHLEVNSEIEGVGWSEPLVSGNRVLGLLSSQQRTTCEVIPASFIQAILEARRKGAYSGLGFFDFVWQPASNPANLSFLKLEGEERGVIVIEGAKHTQQEPSLKPRDIILQIEGFDIDIQGDYRDPEYGYLMLENLSTRGKWAGDKVRIKVWREGKEMEVFYTLPKAEYSVKKVPEAYHDQEPEYLVVGGLVFQPLSQAFLSSWGEDWRRRAPFRLSYYVHEEATPERPSIVLLSSVLPDIYNLGYQESRYLVVDQVNGKKISTLPDLRQALQQSTNGFNVIQFMKGDSLQRMVLDAAEMEQATKRVLQRYGIPSDHWFNQPAKQVSAPASAKP